MRVRPVVRTLAVIAVALLAQFTVVLEIRVDGLAPDVMVLLPIAAGLAGGPVEGALVGFASGMAADLLMPTPFGLSGLVGTLVGFAVGTFAASSAGLAREVRGLPTLVALAMSAASVMLYAVLGAVLGESQFLHVDLAVVIVVVSVLNALLAGPTVRIMRWAFAPPADRSAAGQR